MRVWKVEDIPHPITNHIPVALILLVLDDGLVISFPSNFNIFNRSWILWACILCFSFLLEVVFVEITIMYRTFSFLSCSFWWSPKTIQSFYSLDQVKQFIFSLGYFSYQETIYLSSSLYNPPQRGSYISSPNPCTAPYHFTTAIVFLDIAPSGDGLFIIASSGGKYFILVESCLFYSEKKLWVHWILLEDINYFNYSPSWSWYWNFLFIKVDGFNYLPFIRLSGTTDRKSVVPLSLMNCMT